MEACWRVFGRKDVLRDKAGTSQVVVASTEVISNAIDFTAKVYSFMRMGASMKASGTTI